MTRPGWLALAAALLIGVSACVARRWPKRGSATPARGRLGDRVPGRQSADHGPELSAASLHELALSLPPQSRLIFCDDSEVGKADGMLPDVGLMAAIEMSPAAYAVASERLIRYLAARGLAEFHATEIVAGRNRSAFAGLSPEERLDAFREISSALVEANAMLSYVHIPRSQYDSMRVHLAADRLDPGLDWKPAIRRVLLRTLIEEAAGRTALTMIVVDQDRPQPGPRIVTSEVAPGLAGGGVISAPSDQVIGLQLADLAAFCMGRYLRRRSRYRVARAEGDEGELGTAIEDGEVTRDGIAGLGGFDGVVVETLAGFENRARSLLASAAVAEHDADGSRWGDQPQTLTPSSEIP